MRTLRTLVGCSFGLVAVLAVGGIRPAAAQLDIYLSAPKSAGTIYSNVTTETFENVTTGTYNSSLTSTIGTYTVANGGKYSILSNDQYGTGTGKYMSFGAQSGSSKPVTLTFNSAQGYFGFSWNAGDNNNKVSFYNGSNLVGSYSTSNLVTLLSNATVTAIDGTVYQSNKYYGQPVGGQNTGEPYGFLNFIDTTGSGFTKVVFENSSTTSTGFETDNHTIKTTAPTPDGSFVRLSGVNVPEPASVAFLSLGVIGGLLARRRNRR